MHTFGSSFHLQDRKMGGVYHRGIHWRVASKGGNVLLNQIHRKLIFQKNSKNQTFWTEKISDLAQFQRINIRTEKNPKICPAEILGINVIFLGCHFFPSTFLLCWYISFFFPVFFVYLPISNKRCSSAVY